MMTLKKLPQATIYGGYTTDEKVASAFNIDFRPETDKYLSIHLHYPFIVKPHMIADVLS